MKGTLYFTECEHNGDLENYLADVRASGAKVLDSKINYDAETARVEIEFEEGFVEKFRQTSSCGSSNLDN